MPALYSTFFDEPLSTFRNVCKALGEPRIDRPARRRLVARVYYWDCGCRVFLRKAGNCTIALCEHHGQRDSHWLRIETPELYEA
jgi:hypothetical protein